MQQVKKMANAQATIKIAVLIALLQALKVVSISFTSTINEWLTHSFSWVEEETKNYLITFTIICFHTAIYWGIYCEYCVNKIAVHNEATALRLDHRMGKRGLGNTAIVAHE